MGGDLSKGSLDSPFKLLKVITVNPAEMDQRRFPLISISNYSYYKGFSKGSFLDHLSFVKICPRSGKNYHRKIKPVASIHLLKVVVVTGNPAEMDWRNFHSEPARFPKEVS